MVDVIVYKPSPYGLVFMHDKPLGLRPRVYHLSHQTWVGLCVLYIVTLLEIILIFIGCDTSQDKIKYLRDIPGKN